jgi:hypothetical protein
MKIAKRDNMRLSHASAYNLRAFGPLCVIEGLSADHMSPKYLSPSIP